MTINEKNSSKEHKHVPLEHKNKAKSGGLAVYGRRLLFDSSRQVRRDYRTLQPEAVWAGTVWALSAILALGLLAATWVVVTPGSGYYLAPALSTAVFIGVLAGGMVSGRRVRNLGWLHGGLVGLAASLVLIILAALAGPLAFGLLYWAMRVVLLTIVGAVGGVVGINLPQPSSRVYHHGLG